MKFVEMRHPSTGGTANIPLSAVSHHQTRGWELTAVEPAAETVPDASSDIEETHEEND